VFAALVVAALVLKYWPLIVGVICLTAAVYFGRRVADRHAGRVEAERCRLAGLRVRAEAQHIWALQGDERGWFGEYPPAAI
jgi:hypothetical protein